MDKKIGSAQDALDELLKNSGDPYVLKTSALGLAHSKEGRKLMQVHIDNKDLPLPALAYIKDALKEVPGNHISSEPNDVGIKTHDGNCIQLSG